MGNLIVSRAIPAPTPRIAETMDADQLKSHRARIAFDVRVTLSAYFDPSEAEDVNAGLLAWFCDELQDWKHEQVVWALREWNRDRPRHRPTPGDIVSILKRARGEKLAREMAAKPAPEPARDLPTPERRAEIAAEVSRTMAALGKQGPKAIIDAEIAAAATDHDVTEDEIRSYDRRPHVVAARDQVIRAAHERGIHMAEIARVLGRDHSSIIHAIRKGAA